jgi:DNA polymerase-3 subunit beta
MDFIIDRDIFLKSLGFANGIIEKKTTLPILSYVLIEAKNSKIKITATDLDIIYFEEVLPTEIKKEGSTTTSASIIYDILRKLQSGTKVEISLQSPNKLKLVSGNSKFNLLCISPDNFPLSSENISEKSFEVSTEKLLKLLNKTKISISNDDTRHYLNGIFLHLTEDHGRNFLTAVATDSHRLSSSSLEIENTSDFSSLILPRKTVYQLSSLLSETSDQLTMQTSENKIKFTLGKMKLISKVIDGKFPDYKKVVPINNDKILAVSSKDFINSIERVASVSLDRKEGVKLLINKDNIQLSVNSANSGEGNEKIKAEFTNENLNISFNSKYLIDIASEVEDKNLKMRLKDSVSPVLIEDASDKNSYYVIMPMKI